MNPITKRDLIVFLTAAALLAPGLSGAAISLQSTPSNSVSGIFNNLPAPVSDLIKNFQDLSNSINSQVGRYINIAPTQGPINLNQISQLNITGWLRGLLQNSFLSGIYSITVKVFQLVGNLAIWILGILTDLIKHGLSLLY